MDQRLPKPALPGRNAALLFDLDGTLVPFADDPSRVALPDELRRILVHVRDLLDGALGIISGRGIDDLDAIVQIPRIAAAGLHGGEWRTADGQRAELPIHRPIIEAALRHAHHRMDTRSGLLIEDKGSSIALHFRQCPDKRESVEQVAFDLLRISGSGFELQQGNCVIELKPAGVDKGTALHRLMESTPFKGRNPWFIGDDRTDEHAFECVNRLGGSSVVVGSRRPTAARAALANPNSVRRWLGRMIVNLDTTAGDSPA